MPATITVQASGPVTEPFGSVTFGPLAVTGTLIPSFTSVNLVSGNNTLTVPAGSVGCIICPPVANNQALKVKTTVGDAGIFVPQASPSVFFFDPANLPASLFVNAAGNTAGLTQVVFF